jgi:predicted amidohydrolase
MSKVIKLAAVQFAFDLHEPESNLQRAEACLSAAAQQKADVVVFPELFLTGPLMNRLDLADAKGAYRDIFRGWARRHGVDLVAGTVVEKVGRRFFNVCYYVDRRGRVLARYCKRNLWLTEKHWVTPGREVVTAATRWGIVGLSICWDLAFPEVYRDLLHCGARLIVCCACWSREDAGPGLQRNRNAEAIFIDSCTTARAVENEAAVVFCNVAGGWQGRTKTLHSIGHTQAALPFLGAVAKISHGKEAVLLADLDLTILDEAEQAYEIKKDRLPPNKDRLTDKRKAT